MKLKNICTNSFLTLISATISLFLGELITRIYYKNITTTGDNFSYFAIKWKKKNVHLNKYGFRDKNHNPKKAKNICRIIVIGDSITYGQGIKENERFTNLLEKDLNNKNNHFEFLNFGIPGAETIDEYKTIKDKALKFHPNIIIIQWFVNDVEGHHKEKRPKFFNIISSLKIHNLLQRHSALYFLVNQQYKNLQLKLNQNKSYINYMVKTFKNNNSPEMLEAKKYTKKIISICKLKHIETVFILWPYIYPNWQKNYALKFLHKRILNICQSEKIRYLDLTNAFKKILFVNKFDHHPSAYANFIAEKYFYKNFSNIFTSFKFSRQKSI